MSKIEDRKQSQAHTIWSKWHEHHCPDNDGRVISADDTKEFARCKCYDEKPHTTFTPKRPSTNDIEILRKFDAIHGTKYAQGLTAREETKSHPEILETTAHEPPLGTIHQLPLRDDQVLTMEQAFGYMRAKGVDIPKNGMILWENSEGQTCWVNWGDQTNAETVWALESVKHQLIREQFQ